MEKRSYSSSPIGLRLSLISISIPASVIILCCSGSAFDPASASTEELPVVHLRLQRTSADSYSVSISTVSRTSLIIMGKSYNQDEDGGLTVPPPISYFSRGSRSGLGRTEDRVAVRPGCHRQSPDIATRSFVVISFHQLPSCVLRRSPIFLLFTFTLIHLFIIYVC